MLLYCEAEDETIRLLSDFDDTLFRTHPNADLEAEMQRLSILAARLS